MESASTTKKNTKQGYSYVSCRDCGDEIYFDDNHLSKNGKKVPLGKEDGKPHQCPNRPFNRSSPVNTGSFGPTIHPVRMDTIEPMLAEILRAVKKIEKRYVTEPSPDSDSAYDPEGGT